MKDRDKETNHKPRKTPPKILRFLMPSIADILWIGPFFWVLYIGRKMMNADGDLGFHLTVGRYILDNRRIPLQDLFSHTMTGEPVIQHEWLTTALFAALERAYGFSGIIVFCALVIATSFWLIYKRAHKGNTTLITVIPVILLAIISSVVHWLARPHVVTFLLLALWMILLDQLRQGKLKRWWLMPLIMVLWTNMHGYFIMGFVTWATYGIGVYWDSLLKRFSQESRLPINFWRVYLVSGFTSFLATFINPSGINLWTRVISHAGSSFLADRTVEFQSPDFHLNAFWPFMAFIVLMIVVMAFSQQKFRSEWLFTSVAWLAFSLYSGRNVPLFAIVATPLLVQGLDNLMGANAPQLKIIDKLNGLDQRLKTVDQQLKGAFWPIVSVGFAALVLSFGGTFNPDGKPYTFDPEVFPVDAVDWLEENPQEGEMFNYYNWGGYLQYRLWPNKRVFIDSKADFYGEDFVRQYLKVMEINEGWEQIFQEHNVDWIILPTDTPVVRLIRCQLGWETLYEDKTAVILRK